MTAGELSTRFMLALCIWREARGESLRGKQLVGAVIRNRVADPRWPKTFTDVILQPRQFSSFNSGDPNAMKFPRDDDPSWRDSVSAAETVLGQSPAMTTANHYHVLGLMPTWADADKVVDREGHHVFYAL